MLIKMKIKNKIHKYINVCQGKSVQTNPLVIASQQQEFLLDGILGEYA